MIALSQKWKSAIDYGLTITGGVLGFLGAHFAAFPIADQGLVTTLSALGLREVSHLSVAVDTGQLPTLSTLAGDINPVWTNTLKPSLLADIQKYVKSPTDQALATAVVAALDQKIQALSTTAPVSPLAVVAKPVVITTPLASA